MYNSKFISLPQVNYHFKINNNKSKINVTFPLFILLSQITQRAFIKITSTKVQRSIFYKSNI